MRENRVVHRVEPQWATQRPAPGNVAQPPPAVREWAFFNPRRRTGSGQVFFLKTISWPGAWLPMFPDWTHRVDTMAAWEERCTAGGGCATPSGAAIYCLRLAALCHTSVVELSISPRVPKAFPCSF